MLKAACLIARKDLRLVLSRGAGLVQALLLGLLLIFVFSLSRETGETMSGQGAATIFWLSSAFCQVLSFNMLYGLEELDGPPAAGTPFLAFIRPLPEPEAKKLLRILSAGQECLFLNFWLCTPVTENDILYRYYLAGGIAGEPEKTGWDAFLHEKPGATALYRIVPAGKSR